MTNDIVKYNWYVNTVKPFGRVVGTQYVKILKFLYDCSLKQLQSPNRYKNGAIMTYIILL